MDIEVTLLQILIPACNLVEMGNLITEQIEWEKQV